MNGDRQSRLPNTTNIGFEALPAEGVLMLLSKHEVCVSSGSACSSGSLEPSHVLAAMGVDPRVAHGAVRFSLSRFTTAEEIDRTLEIVPAVVDRLRSLQPREVTICCAGGQAGSEPCCSPTVQLTPGRTEPRPSGSGEGR